LLADLGLGAQGIAHACRQLLKARVLRTMA
jgi:hypothetical protein